MQQTVRRGISVNRALIVPLLCSLLIAALVVLDPVLSSVMPRSLWITIFLGDFPYRSSLVVIVFAFMLWMLVYGAARAGNYRAFLLILLVASLQLGGLNIGPIDLLDILTLVALMAWTAEVMVNPSTPFVFPGLLFFGLLFLIMDLPYLAVLGAGTFLVGYIKLLKTIMIAFLVVNFIRDRQMFMLVTKTMIIVAVVSAIIGITQSFLYLFADIFITFMDDLESAFKPTPIGYILRASALCPTAQFLSSFLLITTPFILLRLSSTDYKGSRGWLLFSLIIVLSGIVMTWNFGAIIAVFMMLIIFPVMRWPRRIIQILLGYMLLFTFMYYTGAVELLYDYTVGDAGVAKGIDQRHFLMTQGMDLISRNAWLGTGLGGFSYYTQHINGWPVHNAGVQAWVELGFAGMLAFVAMNLILLTQLLLSGVGGDGENRVLFRMLALGHVGLIQLMFTEPYLNSQIVWFYLGLAQSAILVFRYKSAVTIDSPVRTY